MMDDISAEAAHRAQTGMQTAAGAGEEAARVRLGSHPDTAPDVLMALATDPSVTVRAAVAINQAAPREVDRILAGDADERVRALLARKLSHLVPGMPAAGRAQMEAQALALLTRLVEDEAERVRAAIAEVVKDVPGAPRELILRLAHDSAIQVCDPVIRLSPLLTAEDLLGLLAHHPSPAAAVSVARRANLSEAVADAIAETGGPEAVAALLNNHSAAIREATLDALTQRAGEHPSWHAPLVHRPHLSARAARLLSDMVTTQLLGILTRRADLDPAVAAELRRRLDERRDAEPRPATRPDPDIETALSDARALAAAGGLTEGALLATVQRGEARLATAMLAVAAEVSASVVDRAATLRSAKGLVSLIWKAGFTMRVAAPLQTLLARLAPEAVLRATPSGGFPLAVEEMRWQLDFLARMGR